MRSFLHFRVILLCLSEVLKPGWMYLIHYLTNRSFKFNTTAAVKSGSSRCGMQYTRPLFTSTLSWWISRRGCCVSNIAYPILAPARSRPQLLTNQELVFHLVRLLRWIGPNSLILLTLLVSSGFEVGESSRSRLVSCLVSSLVRLNWGSGSWFRWFYEFK